MEITITSPEFTAEGMRESWAEDETLSAAAVHALADAMYAYLVIHVGETMPGWSFGSRGFTGPVRKDAIMEILTLHSNATDRVVEQLEMIAHEADEA